MMLGSCSDVVSFFFFQAEEGIRDLVRSRGLGDVYKRQASTREEVVNYYTTTVRTGTREAMKLMRDAIMYPPVSYTHLTLPTSDLV